MDNRPARAFAWRRHYFYTGHSPSLQGISSIKNTVNIPSPLFSLYWRVPVAVLFVLAACAWFIGGVLVVFSLRRQARQKKPFWGWASVAATVFVLLSSLSLHYYSLCFQTPAGTIMASTPAHSSPEDEAPSLFEFKEGDEVQILRSQGEWNHVQKSATAVGWVKKASVFRHSGI